MLKKLVLISLVLALIPLSFVFAGGGVDKGEFLSNPYSLVTLFKSI